MPSADGRFLGVFISAAAWNKVFGLDVDPREDEEVELDVEEPEFGIVWTPDPSLDGAHFTAE